MYDIKQLEQENKYIIRKEPKKIYVYSYVLIIFSLLFFLVSIFYKFNINKTFISNIIFDNKKYYIETNISKTQLENLEKTKLLIENREYDYELVNINRNDYNNSYNIILSIDFDISKLKNKSYMIITFQTKNTTVFKELVKKIKEELN